MSLSFLIPLISLIKNKQAAVINSANPIIFTLLERLSIESFSNNPNNPAGIVPIIIKIQYKLKIFNL